MIRGLKVVSAKEMAAIEKKAFSQGVSEEALMLSAGMHIAKHVLHYIRAHHTSKNIILLIGKGNNGADGYVAGQDLLKKGCRVLSYQVCSYEEASVLNQKHCEKFKKAGGIVHFISDSKEVLFEKDAVIIDGLLGTGFQHPVTGLIAQVIEKANQTKLPIIAIDIPSGLDGNTGKADDKYTVRAAITICFSLPKLGFFLADGWNYVGKPIFVDIGLPSQYIDSVKAEYIIPDENELAALVPNVKRTRHKYEAGFLVGIAGSKGLAGAAKLSALAALRSGAGMMKLVSFAHSDEMTNLPYEVIHQDLDEQHCDEILQLCKKASALFIGPGIGREEKTFEILKQVLKVLDKPTVFDADALFFFAEELSLIPKNTILTPHKKEMLRLLGIEKALDDTTYFNSCKEFARKHQIILVAKGAPTFIFTPEGEGYIMIHGDPGMATAGAGDVLTGIIGALLSQGVTSQSAALLGVYLQGIAGEKAALEKTSYSMIASDIIKCLPQAFKSICSSK